LDLTHDAILVRTLENKIVFWNQAAQKLYGSSKDEVLAKAPHQLLRTVFPPPLAEIEAEVLKTGYWEGEVTHHQRDGTPLIVSSRWAMSTEHDKPPAILESHRNITHRKHEEQKFRKFWSRLPMRRYRQ